MVEPLIRELGVTFGVPLLSKISLSLPRMLRMSQFKPCLVEATKVASVPDMAVGLRDPCLLPVRPNNFLGGYSYKHDLVIRSLLFLTRIKLFRLLFDLIAAS